MEDLQAAVQSLKGIVRGAESQAERESRIAEQARKASLTLQVQALLLDVTQLESGVEGMVCPIIVMGRSTFCQNAC